MGVCREMVQLNLVEDESNHHGKSDNCLMMSSPEDEDLSDRVGLFKLVGVGPVDNRPSTE